MLDSTQTYQTIVPFVGPLAWTTLRVVGYALAGTVAATGGLIITFVALQVQRIRTAPDQIPWAGVERYKVFPKLRATIASLARDREHLEVAWERYTSTNKPFTLPNLLWPLTILPPSEATWLISQPEHVLSVNKTQDDVMGLAHLGPGPTLESVHDFSVITRDLTRQIPACTMEMFEEVKHSFDAHFGDPEKGSDWQDIKLMKIVESSVLDVASRLVVGAPLCRSEQYRKAVSAYITINGFTALFVQAFVPPTLSSLAFGVLKWPVFYSRWRAARLFYPEVECRVAALRDARYEKEALQERENDLMQWIIESAAAKGDPAEFDPKILAHKLLLLNLFTIATLYLTLSTTLLTLLSSSDAADILATLRGEATEILPTLAQDPTATRKMHAHDSLIRETMRYEPMSDTGLMREVLSPSGITTPSGTFLPQGSHVGVSVRQMQRSRGKSADDYQPFRFVPSTASSELEVEASKPPTAVQVSESHLSFGMGRHVCPGRFFAVNTLKLMLGYMVLTWEFEPLKEKAKFIQIAGASIGSEKTVVRIRRRVAGGRESGDVVEKTSGESQVTG
nr:hypothetical protein B0A51_14975 [Rachicladosporium sp. CCFEE 5018]